MSIMPEGGWGDPPPQENVARSQRPEGAYTASPAEKHTNSYFACKVCDRGALIPKKVHRLSGPAVLIGYILLIPSILGMVSCGAILVVTDASISMVSSRPHQSTLDATFRRNCANSVRQSIQEAGFIPSQASIEQYCECALSTFKETGSEAIAGERCGQRAREGTLDPPNQDVDVFYSANSSHGVETSEGSGSLLGIISSALLLNLVVAFFIGGLLGWLLVMKKRVLQCNLCGAVVNAS
jgi:hypothetical protein